MQGDINEWLRVGSKQVENNRWGWLWMVESRIVIQKAVVGSRRDSQGLRMKDETSSG